MKTLRESMGTTREIPLLPLRGALVFPHTVVPLNVGRPRSVRAVEEAVARERCIVLASQREFKVDEPAASDIFPVGTVAIIKQVTRAADGTVKVVAEGRNRCRILRFVHEEPYLLAVVEEVQEGQEHTREAEALMRGLIQQWERYVRLSRKLPPEALLTVVNVEDPGRVADTIAAHLALKPEDKQEVLAAIAVKERLEKVSTILGREMELLELEKRISVRVRKQMEKTQREYYLREQLKAIQRELGERDEHGTEAEEYHDKIEAKQLPKDVEEKAMRELDRLEKMPPMAAEAVVVRTYLDWMLDLPWTEATADNKDIRAAERILDEDHHALKKVKERILEYLAVRQLVEDSKGPILCLIGPPGVGKTSLGKSVARALGRKFVRISLGGVRDEAEIRGHRRTYVGALPGRIIQGMRQAGSKNPVFLLDEVDKMSSDFRGDPASALLEVLDPEQNCRFSDHYLELAYDLSRVLFITTANVRYNIPRPLLDRMETIDLPGYTEEEKVKIAERYLLPRQIREHGLGAGEVRVSEAAVRKIIREYTREAGVRNLERELASILRKVARERATELGASSNGQRRAAGNGHGAQAGAKDEAGDSAGAALGAGADSAGDGAPPAADAAAAQGSAGSADSAQGSGEAGAPKAKARAHRCVRIAAAGVGRYLGPPRYHFGVAEKRDEVGVALGVGWTEFGGDVMPIEVTVMKGKGNLTLTGKLGEVMRESAQASLSYVRSRAKDFGIPEDFYESLDVHVHAPEGAVPKEGPSAGVTMACAMLSALSRRPARHDVAMTGEITLRGKVLPVGGIKEKVLAAHRAGVKTMILPVSNHKDLEEVPIRVRRQMNFVEVEDMDEVLRVALACAKTAPVEMPEVRDGPAVVGGQPRSTPAEPPPLV